MKYISLIAVLFLLHGCDDKDKDRLAAAGHRIVKAPEVSAEGTIPALTLLIGAVLVLRGRRPKP